MTWIGVCLGVITLVGATAAVSLRNLVHCALSLIVAFAGLAGLYLHLGAQFLGWIQLLVYVGAVGIVLVFAILLTQGGGADVRPVTSSSWSYGVGIAVLMTAVISAAVLQSSTIEPAAVRSRGPTVKQLGSLLMTDYVIPLEVVGLLLTAALIGAVVIAMPGRNRRADMSQDPKTKT